MKVSKKMEFYTDDLARMLQAMECDVDECALEVLKQVIEGFDPKDEAGLPFEFEHGEWLLCTDAQADLMCREHITESLWAFKPEFLSSHSDAPQTVFEVLSNTNLWEDLNETYMCLIRDFDHFVSDAISADGRGHFLAGYDHEEHEIATECGFWYLYRTN